MGFIKSWAVLIADGQGHVFKYGVSKGLYGIVKSKNLSFHDEFYGL